MIPEHSAHLRRMTMEFAQALDPYTEESQKYDTTAMTEDDAPPEPSMRAVVFGTVVVLAMAWILWKQYRHAQTRRRTSPSTTTEELLSAIATST